MEARDFSCVRLHIDVKRLNDTSETAAKEGLTVEISVPEKLTGKIELAVNAKRIEIRNIANEGIELGGKLSEIMIDGNRSDIEIDCNTDMQLEVISHEGRIEINQLMATSEIRVPESYSFTAEAKGVATRIIYKENGREAVDFSSSESENCISLNGMKSELVISRYQSV